MTVSPKALHCPPVNRTRLYVELEVTHGSQESEASLTIRCTPCGEILKSISAAADFVTITEGPAVRIEHDCTGP